MVCATALLIALVVDSWIGEPPARLHPVVWMGNYLNWAAKRLRPEATSDIRDLKSFWLAAAYWWAG
jgi:adenosylcobinamide-phosphate synthase